MTNIRDLLYFNTDIKDEYIPFVADRWNEPHRIYHGAEHLKECIHVALLHTGSLSYSDHNKVLNAIVFHDIIYMPGAPKGANEKASASYFSTLLSADNSREWISDISEVITATTDHIPLQHFEEDPWKLLVLDIDLSGLAAPWNVYITNSVKIRKEIENVTACTDKQWRTGRTSFLLGMLDRRLIFHFFKDKEELTERAKDNMRKELSTLVQV